MTTTDPNFDFSECAAWVLYWGRQPGGYPPGTFCEHLMDAMGNADRHNFARLAGAFPNLAAAMRVFKSADDGAELLREAMADRLEDPPEWVRMSVAEVP